MRRQQHEMVNIKLHINQIIYFYSYKTKDVLLKYYYLVCSGYIEIHNAVRQIAYIIDDRFIRRLTFIF